MRRLRKVLLTAQYLLATSSSPIAEYIIHRASIMHEGLYLAQKRKDEKDLALCMPIAQSERLS